MLLQNGGGRRGLIGEREMEGWCRKKMRGVEWVCMWGGWICVSVGKNERGMGV